MPSFRKTPFTIALLVCLSSWALATSIPPKPLEELVAEAHHVIVGEVVKVDMIDGQGKPVTDPKARTGPGYENLIRLHFKVSETMYSSAKETPELLVVPLWSAWHSTLEDRQNMVGEKLILLLKDDYKMVYPALFMRTLKERSEIEKLLKNRR